MVFLGKSTLKVIDRVESKHQRNLSDGIFVLPDHLAAFFQLHIIDLFLGINIHVFLEQNLKRGTGHGKLLAEFRNGQRLVDGLVDVSQDPFKQFVLIILPCAGDRTIVLFPNKLLLKKPDDGFLKQTELQAVHIWNL